MPTWDQNRVHAALKQLRIASDPRRIRHGHGLRMGNGPGASLEFHDYRNYVLGDDLRMIDWGVYARSDQLVLRRHRQEISPRLEIILDCSASMGIHPDKFSLAAGIAALFLSLAQLDGAQPVLWCCDDQARLLNPRNWEAELQLREATGHHGLRQQIPDLHPGSERFIISDGLYPEGGQQIIRRLGLGAGRICQIQILTGEEREPQPWGHVRLVDVEGGERNLQVDEQACHAYQQRLTRLQASWQSALNGRGAGLIHCDADADLNTAIQVLLKAGVLMPGVAS